jgi:hypothetical protein
MSRSKNNSKIQMPTFPTTTIMQTSACKTTTTTTTKKKIVMYEWAKNNVFVFLLISNMA